MSRVDVVERSFSAKGGARVSQLRSPFRYGRVGGRLAGEGEAERVSVRSLSIGRQDEQMPAEFPDAALPRQRGRCYRRQQAPAIESALEVRWSGGRHVS